MNRTKVSKNNENPLVVGRFEYIEQLLLVNGSK